MSKTVKADRRPAVLGVDIGGSSIKGAPVDVERGVLLADRVGLPTPKPAAPDAVAAVVGELARHFQWSGPVGCAFPAVIKDGVAWTATNVDKSWIGTDGRELFERATGCPVSLINDADAAGLAEMKFGAGRDRPKLVMMVTLGTGIGSALFMDGRLIPNTELGGLVVNGHAAELGASARARKQLKLSWKAWAANLDTYLGYLEALFVPDLFIIGGGVSSRHGKFLHRLSITTPVVPAEMRNDAGIVGAALPAVENCTTALSETEPGWRNRSKCQKQSA